MESISLLWDINSWGAVTRGFVFVIWAIAGTVLAFELFYLVKWLLAFRKGVGAKGIANHLKKYEATFLKDLGDGRKTTEHAIDILPMTTLQPGVGRLWGFPSGSWGSRIKAVRKRFSKAFKGCFRACRLHL